MRNAMRTTWHFVGLAIGALVIGVLALLVFAPTIGVGIHHSAQGSTDALGDKTDAISALDVIVLRGGTGVPRPGPSQRLGWNVTTYTGRVVIDGEGKSSHPRVVWGQTGAPPAISSFHADRVLLIYPDGGLNAAKDKAPAIPSDTDGEVARWMEIANSVAPKSTPTYALLHRGGHARLLRWRAALSHVRSAESRHGGAQELRPTTFARDTTDQALRLGVLDPRNTSDLALAAQHKPALFFDRDEPDPSPTENAADSTIYVHVSRSGNDVPNTIYLDYWWYLPSGWEGVTVVLDGDDPAGPPIAVSYDEHKGVARYTWRAAQRRWIDPATRRLAKGIDTTVRPLVFVARETHAFYPFRENRHDGQGPAWSGNLDEGCRNLCLAALPTRDLGRRPARWNALRSPATQNRYKRPWCYDRAFDDDGVRSIAEGGACPPPRATADEITRGKRLLALGDSYSSGQGGGDYEDGTDGDGNTCFRSATAWPLQFANRLGLTVLPSLACGAATTADVVDGRPPDDPGAEDERLVSQVDRITGNPDMIVLSIGRDDVRFAEVLQTCIEHDCVKAFTKPGGGDILEDRIARLRAKLPGVYRSVAAHAPRARVIVVGYPRLFPTVKIARPAPDCAVLRRITSEMDYLNERITSLDVAISDAAAEASVEFVDVADAFDGRPLGCQLRSYLNRLSLSINRLPASFHPNSEGQRRIADVFASRLPPGR
ncbi:MAG: SGNH/GDSL hydrolase family protein [Baekduia sp.]